ncbi:MAG: 50S ribosomal protein L17 [Candidatus Lambdaproteobacteria bacterium]|nr:50S ribosomal protein L17 [Candidatus Lambdaproteobacteria bacterium]
MRHLKSSRPLGVSRSHRRAMLRNLVTSVLEHEQIRTTLARAKALRSPLERIITLGKRGDLNARRQALTFVKSKAAMSALFGDYAERYKERPGGFVRVIALGPRRGDGAELALVQLVGGTKDPFEGGKKGATPRRRRHAAPAEAAPPAAPPAAAEPKAAPESAPQT